MHGSWSIYVVMQDRADAVHFPSDDPPGGHAIAFNNVTFSYRPDQPILQVPLHAHLLNQGVMLFDTLPSLHCCWGEGGQLHVPVCCCLGLQV